MFKRLIILAAVLTLSAVAVSHAFAAKASTVKVTEQEWKIDISPVTATVGQPVEFHITNTGKVMHELVIEKAGEVDQALTATVNGQEVDAESEKIQPGESRVFTWTFSEPGAYWLACHVPDHFEAGMKVDFNVSAASVTNAPAVLPTSGAASNTASLVLIALGGLLLVLGGLGAQKLAKR